MDTGSGDGLEPDGHDRNAHDRDGHTAGGSATERGDGAGPPASGASGDGAADRAEASDASGSVGDPAGAGGAGEGAGGGDGGEVDATGRLQGLMDHLRTAARAMAAAVIKASEPPTPSARRPRRSVTAF